MFHGCLIATPGAGALCNSQLVSLLASMRLEQIHLCTQHAKWEFATACRVFLCALFAMKPGVLVHRTFILSEPIPAIAPHLAADSTRGAVPTFLYWTWQIK